MRLGAILVAVLLAGSASAAIAAEALSGMGANIFGNYFQFPKANLAKPPVGPIKVGSFKVELQTTKLADLSKAFGGTIRHEDHETDAAYWLCYATNGSNGPAANVWFISNSLGGREFVMMVAVEAADPKRKRADCDPASAKFSVPEFGVPGLGAKAADLKAAFGATRTVTSGALSFRADEPAKDALGTALNVQYIGYVMAKGVVTGLGVGESSVQQVPAPPPPAEAVKPRAATAKPPAPAP